MSFLSFLNPIASIGKTYLEGKNQVAKAKSAAAIVGLQAEADVKTAGARAANKLADDGQTQDFNLDLVAMQQMDKSFLDEVMIALLLVPIAASFLGYQEEVSAAFESFSAMPDWYQYLVLGVYIVKFGMRGLLTKLMSGKLGGIKLKQTTLDLLVVVSFQLFQCANRQHLRLLHTMTVTCPEAWRSLCTIIQWILTPQDWLAQWFSSKYWGVKPSLSQVVVCHLQS